MKDQAITVDLLSTPVARAVLPRAMKDGKVMIQAIAGRGDAVDGEVFNGSSRSAPTYWGQAANIVSHFKKQSGGSLKGKKIAFLLPRPPVGHMNRSRYCRSCRSAKASISSCSPTRRRQRPIVGLVADSARSARPDRALGLLADECGGRQGGYAQWHPDGQDRHGQLLERSRPQQHRARRRQGNQAIDDRGKRYRPGAGSGDRSRAVRQGQGCG